MWSMTVLARRRVAPRFAPRPHRLGVERLEDRTVPAAGPAVPAAELARLARLDTAGPLAPVGFDLAYLLREFQTAADAPAAFRPANPLLQTAAGTVAVDVLTADPAAARAGLAALGFRLLGASTWVSSGFLPIAALPAAAALPGVRAVAPAYRLAANVGAVTSQGTASVRSEEVNKFLRIDGSGVTVGVLSDSFDFLRGAAADVAAGDLPGPANPFGRTAAVNVLSDGPGRDEGRAMLQIVHDVAPGAFLAFATAGVSQTQFAANLRALVEAGADVLVDDVTFPAEPMFQDGLVAQAVDQAAALGVPYFSAAGNRGRAGYESPFREAGVNLGTDGTGKVSTQPTFLAHDFDPGPGVDVFQTVVLPPGETTISFQWSDPYFSVSGGDGARTDLDLAVFDMAGNFLGTVGGFGRNVGGDPVEVFTLPNTTGRPLTVQFAIGRVSGPAPAMLKYVAFRPEFQAAEYATGAGTVYGHANAAGAIAVGSGSYADSPAYGRPPVGSAESSAGGTAVMYDAAGNPIAPAARGGPSVIAPDGVATSFFGAVGPDGRRQFFGSSAAAPHAAGVAALMLQANRGLTAGQVRSALEATALDAGTPGRDAQTGAGLVQAPAAVYAVGGPFEVAFDGTDGDDAFQVRRNPAAGVVELWLNAARVFTIPDAEVAAVAARGFAGDDGLLAESDGGLAPPGGVRFDGGAGTDIGAVSGTAGSDLFEYTAIGADGGRLTRSAGGAVLSLLLSAVEKAVADARPLGDDALTAYVGSAAVRLDTERGYGTVVPDGGLPLEYRNVERPTVAGSRVAVPGTPNRDTVDISPAGVVRYTTPAGLENGVAVVAPELVVATGGGADSVTIAGNHPFGGGVWLDGGSPTAVPVGVSGDTLAFNGAGGAITFDPAGGVIGEAGTGAVRYTDFEAFRPNLGVGRLVVRAGAGGAVVTPTSATTATVTTAAGTVPVTAAGGVLTVEGGDGDADTLTVRLPADAADASVAGGNVRIPGYLTVAAGAGVELVEVQGNSANNSFAVTPGAVTVSVVGAGGFDRLNVAGTYPVRPGAGSGIVPSDKPVAYREMEAVTLGQTPAAASDTASVSEDGSVTIDVLANDAGTADGPLAVTITVPPRYGVAEVVGGKIVYTPNPDSVRADSFAYRVEDANGDGSGATVSVGVAAVDDPPRAVPGLVAVVSGTSVAVSLTGEDGDPELAQPLRFTLLSAPAHGTLSGFDPATGRVEYTPSPGYVGADSFEFGVGDGSGATARGRVTVRVDPAPTPPPPGLPSRVIVTGAGAGGGPHVKVFDAFTEREVYSFFAYDPAYSGGVRVATGDVDADGVPDVITGTGPGGAAHIKVFSGRDLSLLASFFAFDPSFVGGVSVAAGDFDPAPGDEIVVGAGPGAGPHVKMFRIAGGRAEQLSGPLGSFFAYAPSFTGGVNVAAGNVDGTPGDELVAGAAAGGGPHVQVFDPRTGGRLQSFFAFPDTGRLGVSVGAADLDGDGRAEILTGPGDGGGPVVRVFTAGSGRLTREVPAFDPGFRGGVWVGAVDRDGDGSAELLVAPGRDSESLKVLDGPGLDPVGILDAYGAAFPGGVFVAGTLTATRRTARPGA